MARRNWQREETEWTVDEVIRLAMREGLAAERYPQHLATDSASEALSRIRWITVEGKSVQVVPTTRRVHKKVTAQPYVALYLPRPPWADWLAYYVQNAAGPSPTLFILPRSFLAKNTTLTDSQLAPFAGAQGWRALVHHTGRMEKPYEEVAPATYATYRRLRKVGANVGFVDKHPDRPAKGLLKKFLLVNETLVYISRASLDEVSESFFAVPVRAPRGSAGLPRVIVLSARPDKITRARFFVLPKGMFPSATTAAITTLAPLENAWHLLGVSTGTEG